MDYNQIIASLKKKEYKPIYFLSGPEPYFIDKISDFIEENVLTESEKEFNQVVLYGKEVDQKNIVDFARQFPIGATRRVVILREAQSMEYFKGLYGYFGTPAPSTILVVNYKYKAAPTSKAFKEAIKNNGVLFSSPRVYDNHLPSLIAKMAKSCKISLDPAATELAVALLGSDLSKIEKELKKLAVVVGEGNIAGMEEVKKYIGDTKEFNSFDLNNALEKKDVLEANRIVNYFGNNPKQNHITSVVGSLNSYFSKVMIIQDNIKAGDKKLQSLIKINSQFIVNKYKKAAQNYPRQKLEQIFSILEEYDLKAKGVGARKTESKELLKEMLFKILH